MLRSDWIAFVGFTRSIARWIANSAYFAVPIKWEDAPEMQNPVIGRDYKVRCKVTANPSPYVDWSRDGEAIRPNGRYVIQADGLLIPQVNEGDDGVYTCRAIVVQTGELASRNIRVEVSRIC